MNALKPTVCLLLAACLLVSAASLSAAAETLGATVTAPTTVTVPYAGKGAPRVFLRSGGGKWRPVSPTLDHGRIVFSLDPAKLGSANLTLLINPPAGLVIDDYAGPVVTALELNAKPLKPAATVAVGNLSVAPRTLSVTFRDAANPLSPTDYHVLIDGAPLAVLPAWITGSGAKQATLRVPLPACEYGPHEIAVSAADTSPQANATTLALRFDYLETGNLALAALGTKVAVDSSFPGYESLVALTDGNTVMPGDHCGNDISWASAEVSTDHWAEVTFPQPTPLKEVTVYWAAYSSVSHTPQHFEIQAPEGAGWQTLYRSPAEGEKPSPLTTARFAPVTTTKLRVFMPKGEGPAGRPNLLWIGEIKAR